ncbi:MAG: IS3 family transposase [Clostridium sp.]
MSRIDCCLDNGPTEGFLGIIKSEMYYNLNFENELRCTIKDYIYFYNNRYQEQFGNLAPMEVRQEAMNSAVPIQYSMYLEINVFWHIKLCLKKKTA